MGQREGGKKEDRREKEIRGDAPTPAPFPPGPLHSQPVPCLLFSRSPKNMK